MWYEHGLYQTSDADPLNVAVVEIIDGYAGQFQVEVIGLDASGGGAVSGKMICTFYKVGGFLTLGATTNIHYSVASISGAAFAIVNDTENIAIELTGVAATAISWAVRTDLFITNYTALP